MGGGGGNNKQWRDRLLKADEYSSSSQCNAVQLQTPPLYSIRIVQQPADRADQKGGKGGGHAPQPLTPSRQTADLHFNQRTRIHAKQN